GGLRNLWLRSEPNRRMAIFVGGRSAEVRETDAGNDGNVEDFLDPDSELERRDSAPGGNVNYADATKQLFASLGNRHTAEGGGFANLRKSDECQALVNGQATRVTGNAGHFIDVAAGRI